MSKLVENGQIVRGAVEFLGHLQKTDFGLANFARVFEKVAAKIAVDHNLLAKGIGAQMVGGTNRIPICVMHDAGMLSFEGSELIVWGIANRVVMSDENTGTQFKFESLSKSELAEILETARLRTCQVLAPLFGSYLEFLKKQKEQLRVTWTLDSQGLEKRQQFKFV